MFGCKSTIYIWSFRVSEGMYKGITLAVHIPVPKSIVNLVLY
jgi:hypothetical protein